MTLTDPHPCKFPFQAPNLCYHKVLMHLVLRRVFCITKDYGDRNTLIGLLQLLNVHWYNIHRSPSDKKNYLGHLKLSPEVFF